MITAAWIIGGLFWGGMACMAIMGWKDAMESKDMPLAWRVGVFLWGCLCFLFLPLVAAVVNGWLK